MSANATGTPTTNFSIPKFNTASDAPNGKGVNEMMDALDTLIANPASVVTRPASLADHDVPVWNGTTWVRSATRQINNGGQILPVITTSSLAGGPPGSPTDGDFWIATNCDPNNSGCTWLFQYQAAQATYKWVFVGGSPIFAEVTTSESTTSSGYTALATAGPSITLSRGGDYDVRLEARVFGPENAAAGFIGFMSYDIGGTGAADADAILGTNPVNSVSDIGWSASGARRKTAIAAATTLTSKYRTSAATTTVFASRKMVVSPVRVI